MFYTKKNYILDKKKDLIIKIDNKKINIKNNYIAITI